MSDSNSAVFASDIQSQIDKLPNRAALANKKLSESYLKLAAIQALPTIVQTEVTLKEASRGTRRSFVINDQIACTHCINVKPVNRLQCPECKGLRYQRVERKIKVDLPAGLLTGTEIYRAGLGAMDIHSGKNADLVVKIKVTKEPHLKIGKNIIGVSLSSTFGWQVE